MVNQLADSFFSRLQTYLDPARLGPLLAEFLVNMGIAVFIPALFYCLWRMVNVVILFRLKHLFNKTTTAFAETLIKFSILSLGVLAALSAAGIQTTAVLASLGVVVTQINDYNIGIELRAWLKDERQHVKKRFDLRETVLKTLTDNNVDMPFETIQLAPHAVTVHGPSPGTDKQGGDG